MASECLLVGLAKGSRTLEASGTYTEIRAKFKDLKKSKKAKGLQMLEVWDKRAGCVLKHDFERASRKQVNLDGGIDHTRGDESGVKE